MLAFLETGNALYVLTAVCLLGIMTRLVTKNLYKRLVKESANMTLTKNKGLKELRQKAESTYRMNQGMRDSSAWLEHQLNEMRFMGMTLTGWSGLSTQITWLCLLLGGAGAFFSYWYRLDSYYIVMYGGGSVLMAMLMMLFDNGTVSGGRERLTASLQDYMENVLCPRLLKSLPEDGSLDEPVETPRVGSRGIGRFAERAERAEQSERSPGVAATQGGIQAVGSKAARNSRLKRRETVETTAATAEAVSRKDVDYLKRSLEQIAASREKNRMLDENWLKNLRPEEVQLIGDILKEYLA